LPAKPQLEADWKILDWQLKNLQSSTSSSTASRRNSIFSSASGLSLGTSVTDLTSYSDFWDDPPAVNQGNVEYEVMEEITDIKPAVNQEKRDFTEITAKQQDPGVMPLSASTKLEDAGSSAPEHQSRALGTRTEASRRKARGLFAKHELTLEGNEWIGPSQQPAERVEMEGAFRSPGDATFNFHIDRTTTHGVSDIKTATPVHETHLEPSAARMHEVTVAIQPIPQQYPKKMLIVRSKLLNLLDSLWEKLFARLPPPPGHTSLRWTCVRPPSRFAGETSMLIQNRRFANALSKKMSDRELRVLLKRGSNL
jgi:hypothetical protein